MMKRQIDCYLTINSIIRLTTIWTDIIVAFLAAKIFIISYRPHANVTLL